MPNAAVKSRTTLKTRTGVVLHTYAALTSMSFVGVSCYFVMFIDEDSGLWSVFS